MSTTPDFATSSVPIPSAKGHIMHAGAVMIKSTSIKKGKQRSSTLWTGIISRMSSAYGVIQSSLKAAPASIVMMSLGITSAASVLSIFKHLNRRKNNCTIVTSVEYVRKALAFIVNAAKIASQRKMKVFITVKIIVEP